METYKKTIFLKQITGATITIPLFLTQETNNIGMYDDLCMDQSIIEREVVISGITDSKLDNVRGFDYNNLYSVGTNGVLEVNDVYVKYQIGNITYTTRLDDLFTTFSFVTTRTEYKSNNFITDDFILSYSDKAEIQDSVAIERQNISVIESFSKLRQVGSVSEIATFNNSFFNVNNQTI